MSLLAAVTTDLRLNQPHDGPLPNIMKAKKEPLDEAAELAEPAFALLDAMQVSEIVEVVSPDTFKRPDLCRQRQPDRAVH